MLVKWFIADDEADLPQAGQLRDAIVEGDIEMIAPTLALYELGNTLARRLPEDTADALAALTSLPILFRNPDAEEIARAITLVQQQGVAYYDAVYHAMALKKNGVFVTGDERYLSRAASLGATRHLHEWTL